MPPSARPDVLSTTDAPRVVLDPADGLPEPTVTATVLGVGGVALAVDVYAGNSTVDAFDGSVPRVVLLHGLSQQRRFWGPVVSHLDGMDVAAVDQRGHGDSDTPLDAAYDVPTCAEDVALLLDAVGWPDAVVVGHSWGAAVALQVAATYADRCRAVVLIDGGLTSLADLGDRAEVRRRLEPPRLALPPERVEAMFRAGRLSGWWTPQVGAALRASFAPGDDGLLRSRLGFDRHMKVLDGLLDHDPAPALAAVRCPVWAVSCQDDDGGPVDSAWQVARERAVARARESVAQLRLQTWYGALHDVPLQWPALVAGLVRAAVEEAES